MGGKQLRHILRTVWHLRSKIMKNHYANSIRILLDNINLFLHFNLKRVCECTEVQQDGGSNGSCKCYRGKCNRY